MNPTRLLRPSFWLPGNVLDLKFDEGEGNIAHDDSGFGNHGQIIGATWVDGYYGKALSQDGIDDYVLVLGSLSLDTPKALTVMGWIWDKDSRTHHSINKDVPVRIWIIRYHTPTVVNWHIWNSDGALRMFTPADSWRVGEWFHTACTAEVVGSEIVMEVFFNGASRGTDSFPGTAIQTHTGTPVRIGRDVGFKKQLIDEVRIYNRVLTPEEIKTHFLGSRVPIRR